jgi:streptogramin lyase
MRAFAVLMMCAAHGAALCWAPAADAVTLTVTDEGAGPLATVMVTQRLADPARADASDGGYAAPGVPQKSDVQVTRFTDARGQVELAGRGAQTSYRLRKPGFRDLALDARAGDAPLSAVMLRETDPVALSEAKPANAWLGALEVGTAEDKKHFALQCGFCHQQGSAPVRRERTEEEWREVIQRMVGYGSRLATDMQEKMPATLQAGWRKLRENPGLVGEATPWPEALDKATIREWPMGDAMSQLHDMLLARNGLLYLADNIQDRLYEVNPATGVYTVYKIPHLPEDVPGGLLAARLKAFPRHDSTSNAHSLAESPRDGHLFITPSAQRRLVEFNPETKAFTLHQMDAGFYPHTIRVDAQDRVWFTLALSNQIAMFDRQAGRFTLYDLPARNLRERLTTRTIGVLFKLMSWGLPLSRWLPIDRESTGTPLPYGIDITPDGTVWFARLHTDEIGSIDPATGQIRLIATPFKGPRRLRADGEGNLWIVAFPESRIARYTPGTGKFDLFELPVRPVGSDTPYSLGVDKARGVIWVNGNQSDMLHALEVATGSWRSYPLPHRVSFTRDIEVAPDGAVYTSNANFPSWHTELAEPTLIRVEPGPAP